MKIIVFPRAKENPYQELLYTQMRLQGDSVKYISTPTANAAINTLTLIPQLVFFRICGYRIFHLHWIYSFVPNVRLRKFFYAHYVFSIWIIKTLGYKLIWTAHNVLPHEQAFPDDIEARKILVSNTDLVIAHSQTTIDKLHELGIIPTNLVIIPHGNYVGMYLNTVDKSTARKKLGIPSDVFVFLYFGQVRDYKGVDILLEAFKKIKSEKNYLLLAGKCIDERLRKTILSVIGSNKNILWHDGYVADEDIQLYFNTADVSVLPFKKISTSGSALLALSFYKPVIVPRLGDLALLPEKVCYQYEANNIDGLMLAMKAAESDTRIKEKSKAVTEYIETFGWRGIAEQTHSAIEKLFRN